MLWSEHPCLILTLIVKNDIEQRLIRADSPVIFSKAMITKAAHREAHTRPGGSNHFRQSFLRDLWYQRLRFTTNAGLGRKVIALRARDISVEVDVKFSFAQVASVGRAVHQMVAAGLVLSTTLVLAHGRGGT